MFNWWILLGNVTLINVILSGDNALAISMAASKLPKPLRMKAVILGTVIAIVSLIGFMAAGTYVIKLPLVKSLAALLLIFIAIKLTKDGFKTPTHESTGDVIHSASLTRAIVMIIVADLGMSLDNAITMVSVANGRTSVLLASLLISIPILVLASHLIANIMDRFPWITYFASAYIAWLSGNMFSDDILWNRTSFGDTFQWAAPTISIIVFAGFFLTYGILFKRRNQKMTQSDVQSYVS